MKKTSIVFNCLLAFAALFVWATATQAYQFYSDDIGDVGGCAQCHGAFRSGKYISPADGAAWGVHLHAGHLNETTIGADCGNCHWGTGTSGRLTNLSSSQSAADGVNAISCSGCHGRLEDANGVNQNGTGWGAGLRQHHHAMLGTIGCVSCHADADPAAFTPVGEDVMPPWYGAVTNNVTGTTLNPCNTNGAENFAGTAQGNDNDGDMVYDDTDSDCAAPECTENADCDDGLYCNGAETCDGTGTCQAGTPVDCNDNIGCTDDSCDEDNDTCVNAANDANCPDDGQFCTGAEYCDTVTDCNSTGDPCQGGETCNENTNNCDVPAVCGNGTVETGETCDDGAANGTTTCGCQTDCAYSSAGTACADGEYCNGDETCDGAGACQAGTPVDCSDGVDCTEDICDEVTDACINIADNTNCPDDGSFCNGTEFCDEANDCSSSGDPCTGGDICNEVTDTCDQPGVCGDGTLDAGETCDDGAANGTTTCGCQTDCTYATSGASCGDGAFCNGDETCDGAGSCQAGTPVVCDDGISCTDDTCDEVNDTCANAANDANCGDDGSFCNGTEFCDAVSDCSSTGDPCGAGETCNDATDTCDIFTCADIPDKGTCQNDPTCEWVGNPKNGTCQDAVVCVPDETPEASCTDGIDNDCDGLTDCADTADCGADPACQGGSCDSYADKGTCQNDPTCEWVGNPRNGTCQDAAVCVPDETPEATCTDGVDNDCDGLTDCADTDNCGGDPACQGGSCDTYSDKTSCQSNGCSWSNKNKVCS